MDTLAVDLGIFFLSALCAVVMLWIVRVRYPAALRKEANDVAGFYSATIGTLYAVLVAFLLSGVWSDFNDARANAEQEATALFSLHRLAGEFSDGIAARIRAAARDYAQVMIEKEWPAMRRHRQAPESQALIGEFWKIAHSIEPENGSQQIAKDHYLSALTTLMEHRRLRQLQSRTGIPPILWIVLIVGGIVTVGLACSFGVNSWRLHVVHTVLLTLMLCLALIAIEDINGPYQGVVRIPPAGFQLALDTFDQNAP